MRTSTIHHNRHSLVRMTLTAALALLVTLGAAAQQPDKRHVTPVKPETNQVKPPPKGTDEKVIQQYISGDSATAIAEARKDSLRRAYKRYPRITDLSIGLNIADLVFMAFGQTHASVDVNATLNMWNRFQPVIELGLGWAKSSPDDGNFTYKGKPSPYFKVGANYNFLFKNSPDYQVIAGLRLGYSTFTFDVTDVHYWNSYWQEELTWQLTGQRSHALWGEAGLGLKVKLWNRVSLGWMLRYHGIFNYGKSENARPWFIPGYGARKSSLGFSLGVSYTLPLPKRSDNTPSQ